MAFQQHRQISSTPMAIPSMAPPDYGLYFTEVALLTEWSSLNSSHPPRTPGHADIHSFLLGFSSDYFQNRNVLEASTYPELDDPTPKRRVRMFADVTKTGYAIAFTAGEFMCGSKSRSAAAPSEGACVFGFHRSSTAAPMR